jgi:hypothetical protein
MKILEKYLYDMPFFSCTDPHDASEIMSHSVSNSWFEVDWSAVCYNRREFSGLFKIM